MTYESGNWQRRASLRQARRGLAAVAVGGRVYAIAGFAVQGDPSFDTVETRRQRSGGGWREVRPVPVPKANCSAAALSGRVYVIGGLADGEPDGVVLDLVHRFDPATGRWENRRSLPAPRCFAGAAAHGGKLYVVGGENGQGMTDSVVVYDPALDQWSDRRPLPSPGRNLLGLVATERYLYAIGGFSDTDLNRPLSSVLRYDPPADIWQEVKPLTRRRGNFGVAAFGEDRHILVVGGTDVVGDKLERVRLTTSEAYDVEADEWQTLDQRLPRARASLACAIEGRNTVLAIGGVVPLDGDVAPTDRVHAIRIHVSVEGRPDRPTAQPAAAPASARVPSRA